MLRIMPRSLPRRPRPKPRPTRANSAAPSARRLQADATRERLLSLAFEMVRTRGAAALTTRALATRARVATGLPFAHFPTREALLDALRLRAWDRLEIAIAPPPGWDPNALARDAFEPALRAALDAIVAFALAEPHVYDLVAVTPGETLRGAVLAREVRAAARLVALLQAGARAGAFRIEGDGVVFALALWTSLQGFVARMRADLDPGFRAIQARVKDELFECFLVRIRAEPLA
jgi:AcrR family transcriptional regulator